MPRLIALSLLSTGCITAIDRSYTFTDDIHTIDLNVEAGEVMIVRSPTDRVELVVEFGGIGRAQGPTVIDGVLHMDYDCEGVGICGGELTLAVPDGVLIVSHLSMGDLSIEGVTGPVDATVDSGSIRAEGVHSSWISLSAAAGDVSAELLTRPEELYTAVGAGAIDLSVPAGGYDLHLDLSAGAITLDDVSHDPGADALISAHAGTGDITITGL